MAQQNRVGSHATTIHSDDSGTHVVYHNTAVVTFTPLTVTLRNGGWQTVTTKLRMNQTARQFDLNYHVYQQDYQWFVDTPNGTVPFFDGIQFSRKKRPLSPRQRLEESGYEIISNAKRHWYHIRKIRHQFGDGQFNIDPSEKTTSTSTALSYTAKIPIVGTCSGTPLRPLLVAPIPPTWITGHLVTCLTIQGHTVGP